MNAYEKIQKLGDKEFKRITGVSRELYEKMLKRLKEQYTQDHIGGGAPGQPVELRLTLALEYWREYRTYEHMSNDHQLPKSTINEMVLWVEYALSEDAEFKLDDLRERFKPCEESEAEIIIVDVEEQPIERPKVEQEKSYSGKKNGTRRSTKS
jgi:Mn-dependent DtxR family transcriptional regulator